MLRNKLVALGPLCVALLSDGSGLSRRVFAAEKVKANPVTAGEFIVDPPTLINLGFEWMIQGDDNRNAKAEASYRKKGDSKWANGDASASSAE